MRGSARAVIRPDATAPDRTAPYRPDGCRSWVIRTGLSPGCPVLGCTGDAHRLALYALAVTVRLVLIALYPDPAYVDSYYYVNVARALQAGHGFNIDFVWTFVDLGGSIPANPGLPIPSNAHWMPLASLVQVPFLAVLGPTAWASALPFALIGSLAAPMTWAFARRGRSSRRRRPRRRAPGRAPGRGGVHGPAGQLLALPADRPRGAVAGCPRPQGRSARVRRGRGTGRAGHARPERRHPRRGGARPAVRVATLPGVAGRVDRPPCRGGRRSPRSACSFWSWRRGGRASWPSSARSRRRRRRAGSCGSGRWPR